MGVALTINMTFLGRSKREWDKNYGTVADSSVRKTDQIPDSLGLLRAWSTESPFAEHIGNVRTVSGSQES